MNLMNTTQLEEALDASGEPWNLWRSADSTWHIHMGGPKRDDPSARTVSGATIVDALQAALDCARLPVVPRMPKLIHYSYEKQGDGPRPYKVLSDGMVILNSNRKGKAMADIESLRVNQEKARDSWISEHAYFVDNHIEGKDFYYATN